jgi:glycolate oxidase FAD binding subunit
MTLYPADHMEQLEALQASVQERDRLRPVGGGSKPALSDWGNLTMGDFSGVLEYDPDEYTFTALAGTPIAKVEALLAEKGQVLPFDPPLVDAGATLGGTVAAGLSGPGRFRYGGVRDFLLAVGFVDGRGELIQGGAKVVKNAAGFDLPKLMVGGMGCLGLLVDLTFKVFPAPEATTTMRLELGSFQEAVKQMNFLASGPFELSSLELEPPSTLWLRVAGFAEALPVRLSALEEALGKSGESFQGKSDLQIWRQAREFAWVPSDHGLVKIPTSPSRLRALEARVAGLSAHVPRRYSVAGNVAYFAWPEVLGEESFERLLAPEALSAVALRGSWSRPLLGKVSGGAFARRVVAVLDPQGKFAIRDRAFEVGSKE